MKCIRVIVTDEEVHEIPVKSFEELTVEDWIRIHDGQKEGEQRSEILHRVFGLETRIARVMKAHEAYGMLTAYHKYLEEGKAQWAKASEIARILKEEEEETKAPWTAQRMHELLHERGLWRKEIEVEGRTFLVSQDIDIEGNYGQLLDLQAVCERKDITETARYPLMMAIYCLLPGEGYGPQKEQGESAESHQARFDNWKASREALFHKAKMVDALSACAFFFSSSDVFRETTRRVLSYWEALLPRSPRPEPTNTPNAGASTPI